MIMKKFVFILIALIACLTIQAQAIRLDNSNSSDVYVVQQHIDVGVTIQSTFNNIYTSSFLPVTTYHVSKTNLYVPSYVVTTSNLLSNTSYTEQYRRGVGLISTYNHYNYIQTNNLIDVTDNAAAKKYCWMNIQKYYCN